MRTWLKRIPGPEERRASLLWFADTEDNSEELFLAARARGQKNLSRVGWRKRITCIGAIREDGSEWFSDASDCGEQFCRLIRAEKPDACYFHNLGYDIGSILGQHQLDAFDGTLVGNRFIKIKALGTVFLDSFNLWPMAVEKIGKAFGLEKLQRNVRAREYVMRDVEIIRRAVLLTREFAELMGIERFPNTLGGLAVAVWKAMGGENWFDDGTISRQAMYGGRAELFRDTVEGFITHTDINSLYPWAMTQKFPVAFDARSGIDGYGIADVTIKIPECEFAPLPVRRADGGIFYPFGRIRGFWTLAEIQAAIGQGASVQKIHGSWGSSKGEAYYQEFSSGIYDRRLAAKSEAEKQQFKLLLNNLYGQLLMGGKVTRTCNILPDEQAVARFVGSEIPNAYGSKKLVDVQVPLPDHVNVLHGAYVTGLGRIRLAQFARTMDASRLIYCDTDSLVFTGKEPFRIADALGEMKIEKQKETIAQTWLPKVYRVGDDWKAKGVPRRLAKQFATEKAVAYESPFRFREAVRFYDRGNEKPMSVWRPVTKELLANYDKKRFVDGRFLPLLFNGSSVSLEDVSERNPLE